MKKESALNESWAARIAAAQAHPGGYAGYCRDHGIREHQMYYQRKKLQSPSLKQLDVASRTSHREAAFLPVVLEQDTNFSNAPGRPHALPDAKWVAELILELHTMGGRR